jgi:hypothetical protein
VGGWAGQVVRCRERHPEGGERGGGGKRRGSAGAWEGSGAADGDGKADFVAGAVWLGKQAVRIADEMGEEVRLSLSQRRQGGRNSAHEGRAA